MFCPMCGAPNDDQATYCGNCGAALTADAPPLEQPAVSPEEGRAAVFGDAPDEEPFLPPPPPPPAPVSPPPYTPSPAPAASGAPVSGMAVASLVLGIAGLTVLPFISSIFAVIFGYMARREIRQQPMHTSGDGIAVAGIVLGWIGVGVLVLAFLGIGGIMLCGICSSFGNTM